jgi:hypothetical protein
MARRRGSQSQPSSQRVSVPWATPGPGRCCGSVSSRTWCNCCNVQGGAGINPRERQRRITGGVTLHTAAAWRTDVTCPGRLTTRTLAGAGEDCWPDALGHCDRFPGHSVLRERMPATVVAAVANSRAATGASSGKRRRSHMAAPWLPSARECEIITAPNRTDRHIQRGGQV